MQNFNNPLIGQQTTDIVSSLFGTNDFDYQELFFEFGVACDMIGEAIRSILPLGLEEEIGSKLMCLVARKLVLKTSYIQMHDNRYARLHNRQ